jgi:hypothetical protein
MMRLERPDIRAFAGFGKKLKSSIVTISVMQVYRWTGRDGEIGILRVVKLDIGEN